MSAPSPINAPGFRRLMLSRLISNMSKQIRMLVVMWQVWELTHEPIMLGFIGLAEGLPFIAASLYSGHLVDRREKRGLLLTALAGTALCSLGLSSVSSLDLPSVLAIYGLIGLAALCTSLELPASSAYLQIIVPKESFSKAAAWNLTTYVSATILGPIIGGFLLERFGAPAVYGLSAAGFATAIAIAAPLNKIPPPPGAAQESAVKGVVDGLKFVASKRIIFASMVLDSFAVLFGEVVFILPIFADKLGAGPVGLGFLRAAPAIGSCIVSVSEALKPRIKIRWDWLLRAVFAFGLSLITFGLSPYFPLSFAMLILGGAVDGVSVIIRQSLYQAHTPDAYRGRVASVSGVFIAMSNEIGGFESGLAAQLMGAVPSVVFGGFLTLCIAGFMKWKFPRLDEEARREA